MMEHVIVRCDTVMQCDCMRLRHTQGPILKWPQYFHHILHNGPFIVSCKKWAVISVLWTLETPACEFPCLGGKLEQLQCWFPVRHHIDNWRNCNGDVRIVTVDELVSANRCQPNQYSKHYLLYGGLFQYIQNVMKYVLSQRSLINLVSWPTPCWF